jgi:hypothetical protein
VPASRAVSIPSHRNLDQIRVEPLGKKLVEQFVGETSSTTTSTSSDLPSFGLSGEQGITICIEADLDHLIAGNEAVRFDLTKLPDNCSFKVCAAK